MNITYIMDIMEGGQMPSIEDMTIGRSAAVLEPGGVRRSELGQAMKRVVAALSKGQRAGQVYGVEVYESQKWGSKPDQIATTVRFIKAYLKGRLALLQIPSKMRPTARRGHLQVLEAEDFRDVRFFLGKATAAAIKEQIRLSPGIYIFSCHLGERVLKHLELPPLPKRFRNVPLVMQVMSGDLAVVADESAKAWVTWEGSIEKTPTAKKKETGDRKDTVEWRNKFINENESWSSAEVAKECTSVAKNTAAMASRWVAEKKIFSVKYRGQQWFPRFQFQDGAPIDAVSQVIKAFPEHATGWDLAYFFASPNPYIEGQKTHELLKSDPARVLSLAQAYAHPADVF